MRNLTLFIILFTLSFYSLFDSKVLAWENIKTHPGITEIAIDNSVLDGYLQSQLGMSQGVDTLLQLQESYQNELLTRASQKRPDPMIWNETELSILDWLKRGSLFEDVPGIRARHHFYDPIRNSGLNNPGLVAELINISYLWYPNYWPPFNATGAGALDRAIGNDAYWQIYRF